MTGVLTEVLEKNSEIDEGYKEKSRIEQKFRMPTEPREDSIYKMQNKVILPKFYHHFTCQKIFADKSFG